MAQTESRAERILAIVRSELASIEAGAVNARGYTYWLTPGAVLRADGSDETLIKSGHDVVYAIVPDYSERQPVMTFQVSDKKLRFDLDLLARYKPKSGEPDNPFAYQDDLRDTLARRAAADVEAKLYEPVSLGTVYPGLEVYDIAIEREERAPEVVYVPGWARAILRVAISYRSRVESP